MMTFELYFGNLAHHAHLDQWQVELAAEGDCTNRLIRIPTGFGKTLGVLGAWLWQRMHNAQES
jgi:hypothetical protein